MILPFQCGLSQADAVRGLDRSIEISEFPGRRDAHQGGFAVMVLAGHGAADDSKSYFYLPVDADPAELLTAGLRFSEITEMVRNSGSRRLVRGYVPLRKSERIAGGRHCSINAIANCLSDENVDAVVFTASTGKQFASEDPALGNGAFTKALVEGFHGSAFDQGENTISTLEQLGGKARGQPDLRRAKAGLRHTRLGFSPPPVQTCVIN